MTVALKSAPSKKVSHKVAGQLLLPDDSGWCLWNLFSTRNAERKQAANSPDLLPAKGSVVLGLPSRHVTLFPVWLLTTDRLLLGDMLTAQLEKNGLAAPGRMDSVFSYEVILQQENRTLVIAAILSHTLPASLSSSAATDFDLAIRFYPLPTNALIFFHEEGRIVMAITHGPKLLYTQTLGQLQINADAITELRCAVLALENQGMMINLERIELWGDFINDEISLLQQALELRCERIDKPTPTLPSPRWALIPPAVQSRRQSHSKRQRQTQVLLLLGALYVLIIAALAGRTGWLAFQSYSIQQKLSQNAELVKSLQKTAGQWDALEIAITPAYYPAEILLHCAAVLPPEGVRLTLFDTNGKNIQLAGEAKNAPAAYKYFEDLKKQENLKGYRWQMGNPKLLPNDSASIQIDGNR